MLSKKPDGKKRKGQPPRRWFHSVQGYVPKMNVTNKRDKVMDRKK